MELFRQRGWSNIINDQLTYNILSLMVVAIGLSVAGVMLGVVAIIPSMVGRLTDSPPIAWIVAIIALTIGMLIASVTVRAPHRSFSFYLILHLTILVLLSKDAGRSQCR